MKRRTIATIIIILVIGVAGAFYFKAHPAVRGCADPYYAGGSCRQAVNTSYSPWYYVSLSLIGLSLFVLSYHFLRRRQNP